MKFKLLSLATIVLLTLSFSSAKAQYYCFWVANKSTETFNELKIRESGSGNPFSKDLLPSDLIETGKHFWVKTGHDDVELWDVQITRLDGTPLLFTYKDVNGNWHKSQRYITVSALALHTLVIENDDDGNLTFRYYKTDELGYGHPCDN
jgi:hypothetical protein